MKRKLIDEARRPAPALGEYLTPAEMAAIVKVPVKTLSNWRSIRKGPPFTKVVGQVRYPAASAAAWLAEATQAGAAG